MKAIYCLNPDSFRLIYGDKEKEEIDRLMGEPVEFFDPQELRAASTRLTGVRFLFSGWGCPVLDEEFLDHLPDLEAVFYAAGSIRYFTTDAMWDRGIRVFSAWGANAVPVAQYTLGQILVNLRAAYANAREVRERQTFREIPAAKACPGLYGSTVGLVSLGMIGRMVAESLRAFDVRVLAYDPFVTMEAGEKLGVEMTDLGTLFAESDVVSVHTPWLPETVGLLGREHFSRMKPYAALINTSRGAILREDNLIETLRARPDLTAVLDVTWPEPPVPGSPFYSLPNVFLTSHIAGSQNAECHRMAAYMIEECKRYLAGEASQWEVDRRKAETLA